MAEQKKSSGIYREYGWHRSIMDIADKARENGLVLYGAGFWGEIAFRLFRLFDVTPLCYCDDAIEKIGSEYCGIPICSPETAAAHYPNAEYIVCVDETMSVKDWNRTNRTHMLDRLKDLGVYSADCEMHLLYYVWLLDIGLECFEKEGVHSGQSDKAFLWEDVKNIILVNNMSNSGVWYFEQLMDGHPNILFVPYLPWLERQYIRRLQYLEGAELLIEIMAQLRGYFHQEYEELPCVGQDRFQNFCVDENGNTRKDVYIDPKAFAEQLWRQFGGEAKLESYGQMIRIIYAAYNNCLGKEKRQGEDYWMFYDVHVPDLQFETMYEDLRKSGFKRIEILFVVREPVQHLYSWIVRTAIRLRKNPVMHRGWISAVLHADLGCILEKKGRITEVRGVRFEDLKYRPEETLRSICEWLQIAYSDTLLKTTTNGVEVYFPANTPEGVKYITGVDTTAVSKQQFSEVMTIWDEARLNMLFAKFKQAYGYGSDVPAIQEFDDSAIEKILEKNFKFADIVQELLQERSREEEQYDVNAFVKSIFREYIDSHKTEMEYFDYIKPKEQRG